MPAALQLRGLGDSAPRAASSTSSSRMSDDQQVANRPPLRTTRQPPLPTAREQGTGPQRSRPAAPQRPTRRTGSLRTRQPLQPALLRGRSGTRLVGRPRREGRDHPPGRHLAAEVPLPRGPRRRFRRPSLHLRAFVKDERAPLEDPNIRLFATLAWGSLSASTGIMLEASLSRPFQSRAFMEFWHAPFAFYLSLTGHAPAHLVGAELTAMVTAAHRAPGELQMCSPLYSTEFLSVVPLHSRSELGRPVAIIP